MRCFCQVTDDEHCCRLIDRSNRCCAIGCQCVTELIECAKYPRAIVLHAIVLCVIAIHCLSANAIGLKCSIASVNLSGQPNCVAAPVTFLKTASRTIRVNCSGAIGRQLPAQTTVPS